MGGERQDVNETARIVRVRCDVDDNRCSHIESLNQTTAFGNPPKKLGLLLDDAQMLH